MAQAEHVQLRAIARADVPGSRSSRCSQGAGSWAALAPDLASLYPTAYQILLVVRWRVRLGRVMMRPTGIMASWAHLSTVHQSRPIPYGVDQGAAGNAQRLDAVEHCMPNITPRLHYKTAVYRQRASPRNSLIASVERIRSINDAFRIPWFSARSSPELRMLTLRV